MSSFVCSEKHYLKVRKLTYYLVKSNKWYCYNIGIDEKDILNYIDKNLHSLIKNNVASVNYQYNTKQVFNYDMVFNDIGEKPYYNDNTFTTSDLIGLYNAYNCINYQIELDYNKKFIDDIQKLIAGKLVQKIEDSYECNHWEYE